MTARQLRLRSTIRYVVACAAVVLLVAVTAWAGYYEGVAL